MRTLGLIAFIVCVSCGPVLAQQQMTGKVASVDEQSGSVSITMSGTTGSDASTAPTKFKVQDGLQFNALKPGDTVSFTALNQNGALTITSISRQ